MKYKRAICYSGYREGQSPLTKIYPSYDEIKEDLCILSSNYDILRLYDPSLHANLVLNCIKKEKFDFKVILGMDLLSEYNNKECPWKNQNLSEDELNNHIKENDDSLNELVKLTNEFSDIVMAVSAGNEARPFWGDNLVPESRIVYFINELKSKTNKPTTYCEGFDVWQGRIPLILDAVDFVSVHIYPQWNKVPLKDAFNYTVSNFMETKKYVKKDTIITECGWSTLSNHKSMHSFEASVDSQKEYIKSLDEYAKKNDELFVFFEAFDEPWKGGDNPAEPEKNWGLYSVKRELK